MDFGEKWAEKHGESQRNAARHAYWQAKLACEYGSDQAKGIGDAHESEPGCSKDTRADKFNNKVARKIGSGLQDCDKVEEAVGKAIKNDRFITNKENDPRLPEKPDCCD
jgi:hypothetical protein